MVTESRLARRDPDVRAVTELLWTRSEMTIRDDINPRESAETVRSLIARNLAAPHLFRRDGSFTNW